MEGQASLTLGAMSRSSQHHLQLRIPAEFGVTSTKV